MTKSTTQRKEAMITAHQIASFHSYNIDFGSCLKAGWYLVKNNLKFNKESIMTELRQHPKRTEARTTVKITIGSRSYDWYSDYLTVKIAKSGSVPIQLGSFTYWMKPELWNSIVEQYYSLKALKAMRRASEEDSSLINKVAEMKEAHRELKERNYEAISNHKAY